MIADVPVGAFLSGGIDSSLVAAVAQQQSHKPINTFTKFQDEAYDESKAASDVASHIGSNHTTIECSPNDLLDFIYKYADCYDEPFADSSSLPSMLLSRVARKHVTVGLTGDGAMRPFWIEQSRLEKSIIYISCLNLFEESPVLSPKRY